MRHDDDPLAVDAEGVDDRAAARTRSARRRRRPARTERGIAPREVAALHGREVLRVGAVLQVVDRQHDRAAASAAAPCRRRGARRRRRACRAGSHVASASTRRLRRRASSEATTSSWRAATSRWAAAKPGSTNSRAWMSGAASASPTSWRTRYSSEPPTCPGRHHSRLTSTVHRRSPGHAGQDGSSGQRRRRGTRPACARRCGAHVSSAARGPAGRRQLGGAPLGLREPAGDGVDVERVDEHGGAAGDLLGRRAAAGDDRACPGPSPRRRAARSPRPRSGRRTPWPRRTGAGRSLGRDEAEEADVAGEPVGGVAPAVGADHDERQRVVEPGHGGGQPAQVLARLERADEQGEALGQGVAAADAVDVVLAPPARRRRRAGRRGCGRARCRPPRGRGGSPRSTSRRRPPARGSTARLRRITRSPWRLNRLGSWTKARSCT